MTGEVEITADALVALRTEHPLAAGLGLPTSHDRLFLTPGGREMAALALALDPVYAAYNLARYLWFTRRMAAAGRFGQTVVAGAGFDTRALRLPELAAGKTRVFELDFAGKLAVKAEVLTRAGVAMPEWLTPVGLDLAWDDPAAALKAAGFDAGTPAALFAEGVSFFLPREAAARLARPTRFGLAPGSAVHADIWTAGRASRLNAVLATRGRPALFGEQPFGDDAREIVSALAEAGWRNPRVTALAAVCRQYGIAAPDDPLGESWFVAEGEV